MTDKEYWQAIYEAAKARDRNTDKFTENPYKRASDADKLKAEIKHLNTIVERLDELLGKGINDYIMGIDGVEGLKDMWERSAVREFAEKLKTQFEAKEQHYICMYDWSGHSAVVDCENEVDKLLEDCANDDKTRTNRRNSENH